MFSRAAEIRSRPCFVQPPSGPKRLMGLQPNGGKSIRRHNAGWHAIACFDSGVEAICI